MARRKFCCRFLALLKATMKGVAFSEAEVFSPEGRSLHNLSASFYSTVMNVETPVQPANQPKLSVIAEAFKTVDKKSK